MTFSEEIKKEALRLGFDACGICRAVDSDEEERYMQWINENWHADMAYMARNIDKRVDPRLLVEGAKLYLWLLIIILMRNRLLMLPSLHIMLMGKIITILFVTSLRNYLRLLPNANPR